jgi:hypothetical protein
VEPTSRGSGSLRASATALAAIQVVRPKITNASGMWTATSPSWLSSVIRCPIPVCASVITNRITEQVTSRGWALRSVQTATIAVILIDELPGGHGLAEDRD